VTYTKYADVSKTQDFETIGQLIRDITELTIQGREALCKELMEMMLIKKQLEFAAQGRSAALYCHVICGYSPIPPLLSPPQSGGSPLRHVI
jgi:hypothetical protein